jgi:transposase-like protein
MRLMAIVHLSLRLRGLNKPSLHKTRGGSDIVLLAVLWRLRYKLGFRDVAELLLQRGFEVSYETIRIWEFRFAPLVSENLRAKRRGIAGHSWYLDETYIKVSGRWRYLYRAIDREGNLLDSMLSEHRDKHAARHFLRRLLDSAGRKGSVRSQCRGRTASFLTS